MWKGLPPRYYLVSLMVAVLLMGVSLPSSAYATAQNEAVSPNAQASETALSGAAGLGASTMNTGAASGLSIATAPWVKGSGTADDPFLIESAENLAYLRDQVNAGPTANSTNLGMYSGVFFKQADDIDFGNASWEPIGVKNGTTTATRAFSGHYDGDGHTITGLKVQVENTCAGLFAYVKGNAKNRASVEGLTVEGSVVEEQSGTTAVHVAGLVGYSEYADIRNCGNDAKVTSGFQFVAGIAGYAGYSTIDSCFNHGAITSTYARAAYAAGIVSMVPRCNDFDPSVTNCYNTGAITSAYDAGGIVGAIYGGSTMGPHTIANCYNAGAVVATDADHLDKSGGIVGAINGGNLDAAPFQKMENCFSRANSAPKDFIGDGEKAFMTISDCAELVDGQMKSAAFVATLGKAFIVGAKYPALIWEAPKGIPVIQGEDIADAAYVKDAPTSKVAQLQVTAAGDAAQGELVYQWYRASSEDLSDAQALNDATGRAYTPPTGTLGDFYYYCTVNNSVQALDGAGPFLVKSSVAHIQVWSGAQAAMPVITSQPASPIGEVGQGEDAGVFSLSAAFGGKSEDDSNCVLTYQWQVADFSDGSFVDIAGANKAQFAIPTDKVGAAYYRCVVTVTREKQSWASVNSNVVSVTVKGCEIDSLDALKAFAAAVDGGDTFEGKTVLLTSDITITGDWNPAGSWGTNQPLVNEHYFAGELDGAGHTVTFATNRTRGQYFALIASTYDGAYIHDLVIDGQIESDERTVAGVVAQAAGNTVFERVGNCANITSSGVPSATVASSVGGICGIASKPVGTYGAKTYVFTDCYNKGNIEGDGTRIGGLLGNGSDTVLFTSCYNTGSVKTTASSTSSTFAAYVGGIYGGGFTSTLKNCYNTGFVTTPNAAATTYSGALSGYNQTVNPSGDDVDYYLVDSNPRGRAGTSAQPGGFVGMSAEEFADEASDSCALKLLANAAYASTWMPASALSPSGQGSPVLYWEAASAAQVARFSVQISDAIENGTVIVPSMGGFAAGDEVAPIAVPASGFELDRLTIAYKDAGDQDIEEALASSSFTMPAADVTVSAVFKPVTHTVTFDADGGEPKVVKDQLVEHGSKASKPGNLVKDGFEFCGWKEVGGGLFDFETTQVMADVHLIATWREVQKQSETPSSDNPPSGGESSPSGGSSTTKPPSSGNANQKGQDGTYLGKGASATAAAKVIMSSKSAEGPAGSVYRVLQLNSPRQAKNAIRLNWKKLKSAKRYVLYGNSCGLKNKMKRLASLSNNTVKVTKIAGKKLKKGTYYKFILIAVDSKNKIVSSSKVVHVATAGGKVTNCAKVTTKAKNNKVTLKKGKTFALGAKQVATSKKLALKKHCSVGFETSNVKVASVSKTGVIKAKAKGSCYVYAYAQNGIRTAVKVTVK